MQPIDSNTQNKQIFVKKRPATSVFDWYKSGYQLFCQAKFSWVTLSLAAWVFALLATLIPFLGEVILCLLLPGIYAVAEHHKKHEAFKAERLLDGFRYRLLPLIQLFLINLAMSLVCVTVTSMLTGIDLDEISQPDKLISFMQVAGIIYIPFFVIIVMTAGLIMLHNLPCWSAFKLAVYGCVKNWASLLVFAVFTFFAAMLASLPMLLGLIIVLPVVHTTVYAVCNDIFYTRETFQLPTDNEQNDSMYV